MDSKTHATYIDRIVRMPECIKLTGRSAASIHRDIQKGTFPQKVRLGENSVGFRLSCILKWIEEREVVTVANCKQVALGAKRGRKPKASLEVLP